MDTKDLILTVGLPQSGKTTFAVSLGCPIVCPDAIRYGLHGNRFIAVAEPYVWAIAHTMVNALFLAGHDRVILDACNNTKKRRDEWASSNYTTYFYPIDTPKEVCIDRAKQLNDEVIIPIIEKMAAEYEPLSLDETEWIYNRFPEPLCGKPIGE